MLSPCKALNANVYVWSCDDVYEQRNRGFDWGNAAGEVVRVYRMLKGLPETWNPGDPERR